MDDCFKLLHFHLGSQITNIRHIKAALNEAARVYADLAKRGAGLEFLDVGGGLGRRLRRLADQLRIERELHAAGIRQRRRLSRPDASATKPACRIRRSSPKAAGPWWPITACWCSACWALPGRARTTFRRNCRRKSEQPLRDLMDTYQNLTVRNVLESYHDAQQSLDMAMTLFSSGYLPLDQRSIVENLFWAICHKIQRLAQQLDFVPEELEGLDSLLSDTYFCNFSLFQSMPDSWAIKQLFPVMPIHRLNERPTRHAVLGDITCDSDGKIDQFIDRRDVKRTLPLHQYRTASRITWARF